MIDARNYQLIVLLFFLIIGNLFYGFQTGALNIFVVFLTCIFTQKIFDRKSSLLSPLITSCSICLLFKSNYHLFFIVCSFLAISSKYLIRINNKHVFNPANFGIVLTILLSNSAWVSPGQWGSLYYYAIIPLILGSFITKQASRLDLSLGFLIFWGSLLLSRALYLGDPLTIPIHQMSNGALLLFCFHMISDPKTTPDSRKARVILLILLGIISYILRFKFFITNSFIYALFVCHFIIPVLDYYFKEQRFSWRKYEFS